MKPRADARNLGDGGRNREAAGDPFADDGDALGDLLCERDEQEARRDQHADDEQEDHQERGQRRGAARRRTGAREERPCDDGENRRDDDRGEERLDDEVAADRDGHGKYDADEQVDALAEAEHGAQRLRAAVAFGGGRLGVGLRLGRLRGRTGLRARSGVGLGHDGLGGAAQSATGGSSR